MLFIDLSCIRSLVQIVRIGLVNLSLPSLPKHFLTSIRISAGPIAFPFLFSVWPLLLLFVPLFSLRHSGYHLQFRC